MKVTYSKQDVVNSLANLSWIAEKGEELLRNAGLIKYWDDPEKDARIFEVERMPDNAPLHGIFWVEV